VYAVMTTCATLDAKIKHYMTNVVCCSSDDDMIFDELYVQCFYLCTKSLFKSVLEPH